MKKIFLLLGMISCLNTSLFGLLEQDVVDALREGNLTPARSFLKAHPDNIIVQDAHGRTLFDYAVMFHQAEFARELLNTPHVKTFLLAIDRTLEGNGFMHAVVYKNYEIMHMLLDAALKNNVLNEMVLQKNYLGHNALDLAIHNRDMHAIKLMFSYIHDEALLNRLWAESHNLSTGTMRANFPHEAEKYPNWHEDLYALYDNSMKRIQEKQPTSGEARQREAAQSESTVPSPTQWTRLEGEPQSGSGKQSAVSGAWQRGTAQPEPTVPSSTRQWTKLEKKSRRRTRIVADNDSDEDEQHASESGKQPAQPEKTENEIAIIDAVGRSDVMRVAQLLAEKANFIFTKTNDGETLLSLAMRNNLDLAKQLEKEAQKVRRARALFKSSGANKQNILHTAVLLNDPESVKWVIIRSGKKGAGKGYLRKNEIEPGYDLLPHFLKQKDDNENTPLDLAVQSGNDEIIRLLTEAAASVVAAPNDNKKAKPKSGRNKDKGEAVGSGSGEQSVSPTQEETKMSDDDADDDGEGFVPGSPEEERGLLGEGLMREVN